ncbi:MAG: hypothetical protein K6G28_01955, partial [Acholeplasmatales bacterium]|nr:hypothetical protein [Acholeplasmatales bacterium]
TLNHKMYFVMGTKLELYIFCCDLNNGEIYKTKIKYKDYINISAKDNYIYLEYNNCYTILKKED